MKKIFTIIVATFMAISVSAQSEAGSLSWKPNVGITYSTITGDPDDESSSSIALTAGVEAMYMINEKFGAAFGVNYTGYSVDNDETDMSLTNYYFHVPVTANYYIAQGFALKAGVAINIIASAKLSLDKVTEDVKDDCKSSFISIPVGASYELSNGLVFDLRYSIGVGDVSKLSDGSFSSLMFTLGYKF